MITDFQVAAAGFTPELGEHASQGCPLRQAGDRQDYIGDQRVLAARVSASSPSKTENPAPAMKMPNAASSDQK